jgi:thiol-disulfide isomerase/thioredoxin
MLSRRNLVFLALALPTLAASSYAFAAEKADYSPAAFDAAQKAGKSILIEIHAPWCPTCRAQKPILSQLESEPKYAGLVVFHVDFDSQKDAVHRFGARMQSTLVAFKGGAETGRSVGDTNPESIAALLAKTL